MYIVNPPEELSSRHRTVDFDLHGLVGIRLINPTARDASRLEKRLAPFRAELEREPDITVRFERDLAPPTLNYLGLNSMAFTEDGFYLLDGSSGQIAARIPFDEIGQPLEIVCRSGLGSVPLLFELTRLAFLSKDFVSVHGSAFLYDGKGILITGWTKGGKTEALISFANHGAHYVADEWVLLSCDGKQMLGLPIPVALWDWQLEQVSPDLLPKMSTESKVLFRSIHFLEAVHKRFGRGRFKDSLPLKTLDRLMPTFRKRLCIRELPHDLFKDRYCAGGATVDKVFLLMSHNEPETVITPTDPTEIARRMVNSNEYEAVSAAQHYRAFKFAFPRRQNPSLERGQERQTSLLVSALEGKEAYLVSHPYPVSFEELFSHLEPLC